MPDIVVVSESGNNLTVAETSNNITIYDGKFNGAALGDTTVISINKVTITQPASGATLTIEEGFTLTASNNADVSGTNTGDNAVNSEYNGKLSGITMADLSTGILLNTTGTGEPSIAVAADFPTLNQNTTGTAYAGSAFAGNYYHTNLSFAIKYSTYNSARKPENYLYQYAFFRDNFGSFYSTDYQTSDFFNSNNYWLSSVDATLTAIAPP